MARGQFQDVFQISTNTDTAIIAAPGSGERIYVKYLKISVSVAGTSSRARVENGVGGDVILRAATTSADSAVEGYFATQDRTRNGYALNENTALNVNTSGTGAATIDVMVEWEVR